VPVVAGGPERRAGSSSTSRIAREEESLRESEERFRAIFENMPQHAFMADARGEVFWVNRRVRECMGEEPLARGYLQFIHPDHVGRVVERIERCLKTGETLEETFPLRVKDGDHRWFLCRAVALRDEAGQVVRWFGTHTDVTGLRETQEALREADRRKSQFLAVLSHELRNPLAPIRNSLFLLACAQPGSEQAGRAIKVIDARRGTLTRLVDDLARRDAQSRTEDRAAPRAPRPPRHVVRRVATTTARCSSSAVGLRLEDPGPIWVEADATRVSGGREPPPNALKFTLRGGMTWVSLGIEDGGP
jgi:PAS domain S-box-containing protein